MSEGGNSDRQLAESLLLLISKEILMLLCQSESFSEEVLRERINLLGLATSNYHLGDSQFFLAACRNERVTEGIIRCLLEYFPAAARCTNENGWSPLHYACYNKNATLNIIQILIDAHPDSIRSVNNNGDTPLHFLCANESLHETVSMEIIKLLIEKYPEAVRYADSEGDLHFASWGRSPEFCRVLIEAHPGSERVPGAHGALPLHYGCRQNSLATVEYLHGLFPEAILHTSNGGQYPIHTAILGMHQKDNPAAAVEIVQFLLDCDPDQKLVQYRGKSLLHCASEEEYNDRSIEAGIRAIKKLFDAYPEAIEDNEIASNIHRYHQRVQAFIHGELSYARQAKDHRIITTPDENGQLPLHRAIESNVRLGSIKLLVKGNPSAIRNFDRSGLIPLHLACQHHDSTDVINFLVGFDPSTLYVVDREGNTALHYACRGAKHENIALLLEKYDAVLVSKRNVHGKLPINLLWESNEVSDRECVEYLGSVFQLVRANPEMVMISNSIVNQAVDANATRHGKTRVRLPRFEPPLFLHWWGLNLLYHFAISFWLLSSTNVLIAVCAFSTFFLLFSGTHSKTSEEMKRG